MYINEIVVVTTLKLELSNFNYNANFLFLPHFTVSHFFLITFK